jgi:hypothetical protein
MGRKIFWGIALIFIGLLLLIEPQKYIELELPVYQLIDFFKSYEVFAHLWPATLIFIGLAILTDGWLRKLFIVIALIVAILSATTSVYHGLMFFQKLDNEIEFVSGNIVIEWVKEHEGSVVVNTTSLDVSFAFGNLMVYLPDDRDVSLRIEGGVGDIVIVAPENVDVRIRGESGIGKIQNLHKVVEREHFADIYYTLGIGNIEIR